MRIKYSSMVISIIYLLTHLIQFLEADTVLPTSRTGKLRLKGVM